MSNSKYQLDVLSQAIIDALKTDRVATGLEVVKGTPDEVTLDCRFSLNQVLYDALVVTYPELAAQFNQPKAPVNG